jgi:hypothetical protein
VASGGGVCAPQIDDFVTLADASTVWAIEIARIASSETNFGIQTVDIYPAGQLLRGEFEFRLAERIRSMGTLGLRER